MWFAVSSSAFSRQPLPEAISLCRSEGWILEFSSGIPYGPALKNQFLAADCEKLIHNYFPAPEAPFVLNLASRNPEIQSKTLEHAKQGLKLSQSASRPIYSIHAGFCQDPDPSELGKPFALAPRSPRSEHWNAFLESVETLSEYAQGTDAELLIENNVLAPFNFRGDRENIPTLCADPSETREVFDTVSNPRLGLLLDTAHLKVSSNTLGFDLDAAIDTLAPYVRMIHHSDNDGTEDTNSPLSSNYWFLKHMTKFKENVLHILEVHNQSRDEIRRQRDILSSARGKK